MNPSQTTDCGSIQRSLRASPKNSRRLKERGRPAHRSCFDVGGTPTLLEFSSRFRFSSPARAAALALALLASPALLVNQASAVTWTFTGVDPSFGTYWSQTPNWDLGTTPTSANTTDLVIGGTTNVGSMIWHDLTSPLTIRSLTFNDSNDANTTLYLSSSLSGLEHLKSRNSGFRFFQNRGVGFL